jgi:NAD-dependent DNA ligase
MNIYKKKSQKELFQMVNNVEGFSEIMSQNIIDNIGYADILIQKLKKYITFKQEIRVSSNMTGNKYVMTGFRDKKLEDDITQRGGKITSTVSKNTTALIVKQKVEKLTGKLLKAQELGVPIYSLQEFTKLL